MTADRSQRASRGGLARSGSDVDQRVAGGQTPGVDNALPLTHGDRAMSRRRRAPKLTSDAAAAIEKYRPRGLSDEQQHLVDAVMAMTRAHVAEAALPTPEVSRTVLRRPNSGSGS